MSFSSPSSVHRPKFRWWWPASVDDAQLVRELKEMRAAGYGGAEIAVLPLGGKAARSSGTSGLAGWGTPEFPARLRAVLSAARELDLRIDLTVGPGWPMVSPAVSGSRAELSQQELVHAHVDVTAGRPTRVPLGPASDAVAKLVAVTAARLMRDGGGRLLDPASLTDITDRVEGERLDWMVPGGRGRAGGWTVDGVRVLVAADGPAFDRCR